MRARGWLLVVVVACGRRTPDPAPAPATPVITIPVHLDGQPAPALALADAPLDLWSLCARYPGATIAARAVTGTYAEGKCDHRGGYAFTVTPHAGQATARLEATIEGQRAIIAQAEPVAVIELTVAPPPAPPASADLTVTVAGHPPTTISAAQLDALTPVQHHKDGVPLVAVLAAAKVEVPARAHLVAVTDTERYVIEAAWLRDPAQSLLLKHNNQGLIRFDHTSAAGKQAHLRGVRAIEIR